MRLVSKRTTLIQTLDILNCFFILASGGVASWKQAQYSSTHLIKTKLHIVQNVTNSAMHNVTHGIVVLATWKSFHLQFLQLLILKNYLSESILKAVGGSVHDSHQLIQFIRRIGQVTGEKSVELFTA